jgi:hypothetical protein
MRGINRSRLARVLIRRGRDASDVPITATFGKIFSQHSELETEEIDQLPPRTLAIVRGALSFGYEGARRQGQSLRLILGTGARERD